ncbi:hypothetical protein [Paracoccus methylarcula]|uniref:hypothetical protein n=1 Tax=Paracoccus methylarcula TaxID=72022 RepID=UPI001FE9E306|nr:hypothetical protein [Paracoccus methylarcula]
MSRWLSTSIRSTFSASFRATGPVAAGPGAPCPLSAAPASGLGASLARVEAAAESPVFARPCLAAGFAVPVRELLLAAFGAAALLALRVGAGFAAAFGVDFAAVLGAAFVPGAGFPDFAATRRFEAAGGFSFASGFAGSGFTEVTRSVAFELLLLLARLAMTRIPP